jgi:murein DD-endopeptidase MepM/ murein hydrolase activator NlpD
VLLAAALLLAAGSVSVVLGAGEPPPERGTHHLAPAAAVGMRLDTLFIGGYARGNFADAVQLLASELTMAEREMVGQHLDRVFAGPLEEDGLGGAGRLRVAYERALRPDGSTRSIRVLAAEAGVGGRLHTAFFFEREGEPGYYDPFGRSLDETGWLGPLRAGRVSSPFGMRRMHPILRRLLPHTGVDYAAPHGTPVHATADGVVSYAGTRGGYGRMIELQHPSGFSTRYAHLSGFASRVEEGRHVRRGDVIGFVGMTGLATGPHLHYELRSRGRAVDPERAGLGAPGADLTSEPGWAAEQARLTTLLARTPTVVRTSR